MTFNIEVIIFHFQILFKFKDRKSTRLNSSHLGISYAVFCLKKKKNKSELQSLRHLVCRLLLQKRNNATRISVCNSSDTDGRYSNDCVVTDTPKNNIVHVDGV